MTSALRKGQLKVAKKPSPRSLSHMPVQHLDINERLKAKRLEFKLSQKEWAKALETTVSTIKKIEVGTVVPNHFIIRNLCKKYGIDCNWVYGFFQ